MKKFFRFFLQGLILFIPLIITCIILLKLFDFFVSLFSFAGFSDNIFLNTLMGLVVTLGFVTLLGLLASSFIFKQVFNFFEDKLEHAPFIRHIYSPVKDFTNAFVGNKKRFNKPVMVLTNQNADIHEIGFITQEDLKDLGITGKVAVYLPLSYSLSGRLIIVSRENIKPLDAVSGDVMKFIVSGGVTDVD
jgi:uncharacterized membrane protein